MLLLTRDIGVKHKDTLIFGVDCEIDLRVIARVDNIITVMVTTPPGMFAVTEERYDDPEFNGNGKFAESEIVINRKVGVEGEDAIYIGHDIYVRFVEWNGVHRRQVRIGIDAPREINIVREELLTTDNLPKGFPAFALEQRRNRAQLTQR